MGKRGKGGLSVYSQQIPSKLPDIVSTESNSSSWGWTSVIIIGIVLVGIIFLIL